MFAGDSAVAWILSAPEEGEGYTQCDFASEAAVRYSS